MKFYSTNRKSEPVSLREAVIKGQAGDGGLFLPASIPPLSAAFIQSLPSRSLMEIGVEVCQRLFGDELPRSVAEEVVGRLTFDAPLVEIENNVHILELFHGPTLAFKDFGARFMAGLLSYFVRNENRMLTILVATSGDTGSAVANGFLDAPGIRVVVLYPGGKISQIQEKQMTTLGHNIVALEVEGAFDDCQRLVKQAFLDAELNDRMRLTSANSINIGRLIPQSFYYFRGYAQMKGETSNAVFSVPSGNFGNLTAGIIAKKMGLPISRFIAATNANSVVPQYLQSGRFEPRPSLETLSNAMDVGNPSNFARILDLFGNDWEAIRRNVAGSSHSDEETRTTIKRVYEKHGYVLDPHGAVGYAALVKYQQQTACAGVVLETAHPAKFADIVESATGVVVTIPDSLKECLKKPKQSIPIGKTFEELKSFLLSLN